MYLGFSSCKFRCQTLDNHPWPTKYGSNFKTTFIRINSQPHGIQVVKHLHWHIIQYDSQCATSQIDDWFSKIVEPQSDHHKYSVRLTFNFRLTTQFDSDSLPNSDSILSLDAVSYSSYHMLSQSELWSDQIQIFRLSDSNSHSDSDSKSDSDKVVDVGRPFSSIGPTPTGVQTNCFFSVQEVTAGFVFLVPGLNSSRLCISCAWAVLLERFVLSCPPLGCWIV